MGQIEGSSQQLVITTRAQRVFWSSRQRSNVDTEAGGQLFGIISPTEITVVAASGPYATDERSLRRYRSDPKQAQHEIAKQHQSGRLYLGEWHTHAEDSPVASVLDIEAMRALIRRSKLNSDSLLLIIQGRLPGAEGLSAWSATNETLKQWRWSCR